MALLTALSGAKFTLGFRSAGQYIHSAFDIAVPYLNDRHEIDNHRAMAEVFGPIAEYKLSLRRACRPPNLELPYKRMVVFHIAAGGSRAAEKSWPPNYWAMLARALVDHGMVVAFSGAPDDSAQISTVLNLAGLPEDRCFSLAGRTNLAELAYVVSQARLLVTIDTGIAHLGAAVGAAVVGLHGPTRFCRWGACSSRSSGLDSPHPAAGYIHFGFEWHPQGNEIMAELSVDAVCSAIFARLAETETRLDHVS
jgi:ADP-heptose:LPS heptosyltransferase